MSGSSLACMSSLAKLQGIKRKEGKEKKEGEGGRENRAFLYAVKNSKGVEVLHEKDVKVALLWSGQSGPQGPMGRHGHPLPPVS